MWFFWDILGPWAMANYCRAVIKSPRGTITFLFLFLLNSISFSLLWKPAKWRSQTDPPNRPAKMSCHGNMLDPPASMTRQIHLPKIPPSPLKIPQAGHGLPASSPSPPWLRQRSRGEGARSRPGPPVHLEQVLLLSLNVYISLQNITYTYSTQSG